MAKSSEMDAVVVGREGRNKILKFPEGNKPPGFKDHDPERTGFFKGILNKVRNRGSKTETVKEDGLKVALERRLEGWHVKVLTGLDKLEGVEKPASLRESFKQMRDVLQGDEPPPLLEQSFRQMCEAMASNLKVADRFITSLRLRLGGPYPKREDV